MFRRIGHELANVLTIIVTVVLCDGFILAPWLERHHPAFRETINSLGTAALIALPPLIAYWFFRLVWNPHKTRREITEWKARRQRGSSS